MKRRDFLININNLPEVLSKEETNKLIKEIKNNNKEAKQKLIEHNIKLVIFEVLNKFKDVDEDKEELVSIGIIGLIKAVETFNSEKNILFSTYASRCIDNEILMYIRKQKHLPQIESIDNVISVNNGTDGDDTNKLQLINSLDNNNTSIEDKLMKEVTYEILNEIIEEKESNFIQKAVILKKLKVQNIMINKDLVSYLYDTDSSDKVKKCIFKDNHDRIPIITKDNKVVGILYEVDLLDEILNNGTLSIANNVKEPITVSRSTNLSSCLELLHSARAHMAIVTDRDNNFLGIVTMEDIIAELME